MNALNWLGESAARACAGACLLLAAQGVMAQAGWKPDRPVELIVTCQPGCGPDIAARTIQRIWQDHRILPVPAVVVNKAGGAGLDRAVGEAGQETVTRDP